MTFTPGFSGLFYTPHWLCNVTWFSWWFFVTDFLSHGMVNHHRSPLNLGKFCWIVFPATQLLQIQVFFFRFLWSYGCMILGKFHCGLSPRVGHPSPAVVMTHRLAGVHISHKQVYPFFQNGIFSWEKYPNFLSETHLLGGGFKCFFNVQPYLGKSIQFDDHMFQVGWLKPPTSLPRTAKFHFQGLWEEE